MPLALLFERTQWEDEIKRFAPSLVVRRHHDSKGGKKSMRFLHMCEEGGISVLDADIILSSPYGTFGEDRGNCFHHVSFHRVVADESHEKMGNCTAERRWCCTGTPFTTALEKLKAQAEFLGLWKNSILVPDPGAATPTMVSVPSLKELCSSKNNSSVKLGTATPSIHQKSLRGMLVRVLREVMIRHTKVNTYK